MIVDAGSPVAHPSGMTDVVANAWRGLAQFLVALALCLMLPAWSLRYREAWVYVVVFGSCCVAITLYLQRHDLALLQRRLAAGPAAEREPRQQVIQLLASVAFLALFVLSALDHRFRWTTLPLATVIAGEALVMLGFLVIFFTFRENSYAAGNITTAEGQHVVSSGPYAIVRHPMYAGALIMLLGTPLALGSLWGLVAFGALVVVIVLRLLDEERLLVRDLGGYEAYRGQVRYRLVPFVW